MTYDKIVLGAGLYGLYAAERCGGAGQRVLVLKNRGEDPCVIGVKEGESAPDEVTVEAGTVDLKGQVLIDGVPLETYIAMIVAGLMGG